MNQYYLTDTIFIENGETFYEKNNKTKKVNKNNWHKILNEYGWTKLPIPWIKKINRLSNNKTKNSRYGLYDCEGDGDCFFHCIANAFNERDRFIGEEYDSKDIRNLIAESLTLEDYETLMNYYRIMEDANDFDEEWNPYDIESIDDFRRQIRESGNSYWGDWLLLTTITRLLRLNIFIINYSPDNNNYSVYNTCIEYNQDFDSIFLFYENLNHFQLIGYFNDNQMISYFKIIPEELKKLFTIPE